MADFKVADCVPIVTLNEKEKEEAYGVIDPNSTDEEGNMVIVEEDENDNRDPDSSRSYSCYHCSEKFTSYRALDSHIKQTPLEELEMSLQKNTLRILQNCNSLSSSSENQKPPKKPKPNEGLNHCPICSYSSPRPTQLKSHILIMHTDVRPFQCPYCSYKCINNTKLKLHITAIHTKDKPYQCSLCDYRGSRSAHLKRHTTKYHNDEHPFKCSICDFKTVSDFYLKRHIKKNHDED